jgi:hypothetical protein
LGLAGALLALFLIKRRKKGDLEEIEEMAEADTDSLDSSTAASDDQFVSEYGFSDRHNSDDDAAAQDDDEDDFATFSADEQDATLEGDGSEGQVISDADSLGE